MFGINNNLEFKKAYTGIKIICLRNERLSIFSAMFFEVIYHQEIVVDPHIEICVYENLSYSKWLLSGNSVVHLI